MLQRALGKLPLLYHSLRCIFINTLYIQHPSILGHELRAAHHSYFWLLVFKDALRSLLAIDNAEDHFAKLKKKIHEEHKHISKPALVHSNYTDTLQCFTTSEPIYNMQLNLAGLVIESPYSKDETRKPFQLGEYFAYDTNAYKKCIL